MQQFPAIRLYSDTIIWNLLCDQAVVPNALVESLHAKNASLAFSFHTVYELARTTSLPRRVQLFSYFKRYLDLNVPCMKQVPETLLAEVRAFEQGHQTVDILVSNDEYDFIREEVDKLSQGIVEGRVKEFIEKRKEQSEAQRINQKNHLDFRADIREKLRALPASKVATWMPLQMMTPSGAETLCRRFEKMTGIRLAIDYVLSLLASPVGEIARGLVRADLYYNWRCATRESNPFDLMDDMLHMLQATYCDTYATAEAKQAEYANLLLADTRVEIYDRQMPIRTWLEALVRVDASVAAGSP